MARSKKSADERLSEHVHFLTSVPTRERLANRASACGVSEAEFLRRYIDGLPNVPRSASAAADPALVNAINNYAVAISKVGNNVNQLAAASHQGRDFVRFWREIGAELQADLEAGREALARAVEASEP